jgi:hypothetical protein
MPATAMGDFIVRSGTMPSIIKIIPVVIKNNVFAFFIAM